MLVLHIGNKNYSSWSLRPWVLLREVGLPFDERVHPFAKGEDFSKFSPSAKVPCLHEGELAVWDSLAILEYLSERHVLVWPRHAQARAWARSASAEMHSSFTSLREICSMNCGVRVELEAAKRETVLGDVRRLEQLFAEGLKRFGGPWLAGPSFGAVDAMYAPIAFRMQSYGLAFEQPARDYLERMLSLASMRLWYDEALRERWRDPAHEAEIPRVGKLTADLRAAAE